MDGLCWHSSVNPWPKRMISITTQNDDDGDPDILTKLQTNDPKLKRLVIGPRVETLTFVLQKQSKPDQHLPKSSDEWVKVGEYIGEHMKIYRVFGIIYVKQRRFK